MKLNSNILKVAGSAELEAPLAIGRRYACGMEIAVTDERKVDNEDGTYDLEFKGKLIRANIKADTGAIIKTKDKTAQSVKTRLAILAVKSEFKPDMDDDAFYNLIQGGIRHDLKEIVSAILTHTDAPLT